VVDLEYCAYEETEDPSLKLGMKMLYRRGRGLTDEWANVGDMNMETSRHNSALRTIKRHLRESCGNTVWHFTTSVSGKPRFNMNPRFRDATHLPT